MLLVTKVSVHTAGGMYTAGPMVRVLFRPLMDRVRVSVIG